MQRLPLTGMLLLASLTHSWVLIFPYAAPNLSDHQQLSLTSYSSPSWQKTKKSKVVSGPNPSHYRKLSRLMLRPRLTTCSPRGALSRNARGSKSWTRICIVCGLISGWMTRLSTFMDSWSCLGVRRRRRTLLWMEWSMDGERRWMCITLIPSFGQNWKEMATRRLGWQSGQRRFVCRFFLRVDVLIQWETPKSCRRFSFFRLDRHLLKGRHTDSCESQQFTLDECCDQFPQETNRVLW